jgi:REP element-mobilizing transposase RayT
MPNHVHGIVFIDDRKGLAIPRVAKPRTFAAGTEPGSLGAIVGMFKALSTKKIRNAPDAPKSPIWQRNYYERVIRDDRELDAARQYILDNPRKWSEDKHNPEVYRVK